MKISAIAAIGSLATLASATSPYSGLTSSISRNDTAACTGVVGPEVTKTVTVTAGAPQGKTTTEASVAPASTYVTTANGMVTSVDYNIKTTSTYCPSAGTYVNPYKSGASITAGKPTWTTVEVPYSTVYAYPTEGSSKDCTVVVYQDVTIVEVKVVIIEIIGNGASITTSTTSKAGMPISTPPPPPPYNPSSTTSAAGSKKTLKVQVGTFNGLVQFLPNQVNADVGDVVEFQMETKKHSVTQSDFRTPCTANGMFDTGLIENLQNITSANFTRSFEVKVATPQWFYCKNQGPPSHCSLGMVFGINPAGKMDQFIQTAKLTAANSTANATTTSTTAGSTSTSTSTSSSSAVTTVTVGLNNGTTLRFDPPFLQNVKKDSIIHFDFRAVNHTLTESSFANPCKKLDGTDIDTNFQNVNKADIPEAKAIDIKITSDGPRYFYCKQANGTPKGHCSNGMVFGINIDNKAFTEFQNKAIATKPPMIRGRSPVV
ncbi:MAG: hypothetical protein M1812_002342 [Candelaria pacifica]|nr:MAG: hypothetical protein M1812_002342 [Candelaria pacifica]